MARTQTLVQLSDALLAALDQRAARDGVSRSHVIRQAGEAYLDADVDAEISRRIVEGYERIPQAAPDEWGDAAAWRAQTAARLHQRLDEEEQAAGHEPW